MNRWSRTAGASGCWECSSITALLCWSPAWFTTSARYANGWCPCYPLARKVISDPVTLVCRYLLVLKKVGEISVGIGEKSFKNLHDTYNQHLSLCSVLSPWLFVIMCSYMSVLMKPGSKNTCQCLQHLQILQRLQIGCNTCNTCTYLQYIQILKKWQYLQYRHIAAHTCMWILFACMCRYGKLWPYYDVGMCLYMHVYAGVCRYLKV